MFHSGNQYVSLRELSVPALTLSLRWDLARLHLTSPSCHCLIGFFGYRKNELILHNISTLCFCFASALPWFIPDIEKKNGYAKRFALEPDRFRQNQFAKENARLRTYIFARRCSSSAYCESDVVNYIQIFQKEISVTRWHSLSWLLCETSESVVKMKFAWHVNGKLIQLG